VFVCLLVVLFCLHIVECAGDFSFEEVRYNAYIAGAKGQFQQQIQMETEQGFLVCVICVLAKSDCFYVQSNA
jgi:hypothetical protein